LQPPLRERDDSWRERERDGRKMGATTNTKPPALGQLRCRPLPVVRENEGMKCREVQEMRQRALERSTDTVRDILAFYNLIPGIFKNQTK
jgi:hypothetical protein